MKVDRRVIMSMETTATFGSATVKRMLQTPPPSNRFSSAAVTTVAFGNGGMADGKRAS
jgi:hypothetical protein